MRMSWYVRHENVVLWASHSPDLDVPCNSNNNETLRLNLSIGMDLWPPPALPRLTLLG